MATIHNVDDLHLETPTELMRPLCAGREFRAFSVGSVPRAGGAENDDIERGAGMLAFECRLCGERVVLELAEAVTTPTFDLFEALAC